MKNNLILRITYKIWKAVQQLFVVHNLSHSIAIVPVPSVLKQAAYEQTLQHIKQLIKEGYQVQVYPQQEQKKCECCDC